MKLLARLPLAIAALVTATTASAQEGSTMDITRKAEMKTVEGSVEYFTGRSRSPDRFSGPTRHASAARSSISSQARTRHGTGIRPARR